MIYTTRATCRLCGGTDLATVLDLGVQAISGRFPLPHEPDPPSAPIQVARCADPGCGLVQLRHTVRGDELFRDYWYVSNVTATMIAHLTAAAIEACTMLSGRAGPVCVAPRVLDIGGNCGTFLNAIPAATGTRVCVDPSNIPTDPAYPGIARIKDFFPSGMMLNRQFDLVAQFSCLYDADDPVATARAVQKVLAPDGLWVVEVADQGAVFRNVAVDYFVHEHCLLLSAYQMVQIARAARLKVVRASENLGNGGSVRYYLTHADSPAYDDNPDWKAGVGALWTYGRSLAADGAACGEFARAARQAIDGLGAYVEDAKAAGKRVHVLGASTKMGVILQAAKLTADHIEAASERDARKAGRVVPGTKGIPIISEADSRARQPHAYLTNLSMFRDELLAREREAGTAAEVVFCLPALETVRV